MMTTTLKQKRDNCLIISTKKQWDAITSPVRLQIVAVFESAGPLSVAELADHLNLPADRLYHHIRILVKARLLVELGFRKTSRIAGAVYDLSAHKIDFEVDLATGKNVEHFDRLNRSVLRSASRVLESAVASRVARISGARRNLYARYETAWLDEKELARVREHIESISEIFRKSRANNSKTSNSRVGRKGALMMANCNLAPLQQSRRAMDE
jgi:hypothetical protein